MPTVKVIYWPDDDWCFDEDLMEMGWKSDDYTVMEVPTTMTDEEIDFAVADQNRRAHMIFCRRECDNPMK